MSEVPLYMYSRSVPRALVGLCLQGYLGYKKPELQKTYRIWGVLFLFKGGRTTELLHRLFLSVLIDKKTASDRFCRAPGKRMGFASPPPRERS